MTTSEHLSQQFHPYLPQSNAHNEDVAARMTERKAAYQVAHPHPIRQRFYDRMVERRDRDTR